MTKTSIVVLVPVLSRPHRIRPLIDNVREMTRTPHRVLFIASPGYPDEIAELEAAGADFIVHPKPVGPGNYAAKINHGYQVTSEPFIFTGADDLHFHRGWDVAALDKMADASIGVVGTNDLGNPQVLKGEHSTHSLVRRTYADEYGVIDQPRAIYCERYPHEFVDNELVETAKFRNAWAMAMDSVVEHLHPHWGKSGSDATYDKAPRRLMQGRRIYTQRKKLWAPTPNLGTIDMSIVVATFGDKSWVDLAKSRAIPSIEHQSVQPLDIVHYHGHSLAEARNIAAKQAKPSKWLMFLDADDELAPDFLRYMARASVTSAAMLNPAVQFITPENPEPRPKLFANRPLERGNYLVIGSPVRTDLFWQAGGFDERWEAYEDWSTWMRVLHLRNRVIRVPKAVYRAHWSANGRNNTIADKEGLRERILKDFERWKTQQTTGVTG